MFLHGCSVRFDSSLAATRSANSRSTSSVPRTRTSIARASSPFPRSMRELGVSGRTSAPRKMMSAGTAARPRLMRQP
ncbi:hypothetical protein QJS04_geneDACA018219 [Acorus gramineus]|uniref:Uncharacterized protein n=1 Tax=Acorus gramineus TaxID=55184 RepID=A0AAV9BUR4_ACOGR|nr:hypothetical protein QJS04_geneDACA018219 [Acorus gramineus]